MPGEVRGGHSRQEEAPTKKLTNTSIGIPRQAPDNKARLLAKIEELLGGLPRSVECSRPLTNFRSIQLGLGPVCRARRFGGI